MRIIEPLDVRIIESHLDQLSTGVRLNSLPWPRSEIKSFRVRLDEPDVERLVIWHEAHVHTNGSCKVIDVVPETATHDRVKSFIEGDQKLGLNPVDLRTFPGLELLVVTNDPQSSILYIIDGGHRSMAQFLAHKSFQDVAAFVCVHPRMLEWRNLPPRYRIVRL